MHNHQDYSIKNGIGIRIQSESCRVIRKIKGEWKEIGPVYEIPVETRLLNWTPPDIPPGVLAVALRAYELDHPGTRLRCLLTMNAAERRRSLIAPPVRERSQSAARALSA